jgi:hypothetical protein
VNLPPVILSLLLAGCSAAAPAPNENPLVGAWDLQEYSDTPEGGAPIHAFGNPPVGLFVFTDDGHVSISFMRNPPGEDQAFVDPDPDTCIPVWYCSYFGTYEYDPAGQSWTAHVMGGNIPSYVGTDQTRDFVIKGDTMTIADTYEVNGVRYQAKRVLRRR